MILAKIYKKIRVLTDFKARRLKKRNQTLLKLIADDQFNQLLHLELAANYESLKEYVSALAVVRTAACLFKQNFDSHILRLRDKIYEDSDFKLQSLTHNTYYRLKTVADVLSKEASSNYSVLDVGGGIGLFNLFVPEANYVLADPTANGIGGEIMKFNQAQFDYVISSHVLEHIPKNERSEFLDNLVKCARRKVILLNPFYVKDTYPLETLELLNDITSASWIQEHIDCELPVIEEMESYAKNRNLTIKISPNGHVGATVAMILCDYYARKSNAKNDLRKINEFFNTRFYHLMESSRFPNAYMVELQLERDK